MSGINKAIILGNLGRDPETRYLTDGKQVTSFSIATSQKSKEKEYTEWHNVVCFSRLAEVAREYLRKGSKVYIEGSLRTSNWEKDGVKHYKTEIMARELQMLDGKSNDRPVADHREPAPVVDMNDDPF